MLYAFVTSSYCTRLNLLSLLHVRSYQHTSCFSLPSLYPLGYSSQDVVLPVPQTQFAMSHFWDFKSHRKCRSLLNSYSLSLSPFLQFKDCSLCGVYSGGCGGDSSSQLPSCKSKLNISVFCAVYEPASMRKYLRKTA